MKYNNKTRTRKEKKKTFKRRKRKTRKNNHKRVWNGGVGGPKQGVSVRIMPQSEGPTAHYFARRPTGQERILQGESDYAWGNYQTQAEREEERNNSLHQANQRIIDIENRGVLLHLALQARSPEGITWRDLLYPVWPPSNLLTKLPPEEPVRKMSDDEAFYENMENRHEAMANNALYVNEPSHGPKFIGRGGRKKKKTRTRRKKGGHRRSSSKAPNAAQRRPDRRKAVKGGGKGRWHS
jgi:hypothetical protein